MTVWSIWTALSSAMFAVALVSEMGAFWCIVFAIAFIISALLAIVAEGTYIKRIEALERRLDITEEETH